MARAGVYRLWARAGATEAFPSPADLPAGRALDLRLREILQQARLSTAATGAVIALALGGKMVCRATMGDKAPSAGVCLNTRSGLSGACVQTREMQLCDDTLADPRVNVVACRDLEMRSIVVLPVLDGGELWGVLEVFSSGSPRLQRFRSAGTAIAEPQNLEHGARSHRGGNTVLVPEAFSQPATDSVEPETPAPEAMTVPDQPDVGTVRRDYRTGALTAAVLALAVLLGWMVGRVGWSMAVNRSRIQVPWLRMSRRPRH